MPDRAAPNSHDRAHPPQPRPGRPADRRHHQRPRRRPPVGPTPIRLPPGSVRAPTPRRRTRRRRSAPPPRLPPATAPADRRRNRSAGAKYYCRHALGNSGHPPPYRPPRPRPSRASTCRLIPLPPVPRTRTGCSAWPLAPHPSRCGAPSPPLCWLPTPTPGAPGRTPIFSPVSSPPDTSSSADPGPCQSTCTTVAASPTSGYGGSAGDTHPATSGRRGSTRRRPTLADCLLGFWKGVSGPSSGEGPSKALRGTGPVACPASLGTHGGRRTRHRRPAGASL